MGCATMEKSDEKTTGVFGNPPETFFANNEETFKVSDTITFDMQQIENITLEKKMKFGSTDLEFTNSITYDTVLSFILGVAFCLGVLWWMAYKW